MLDLVEKHATDVEAGIPAVALSDALRKEGIVVAAIRPPTVPEGTARLRVTLHAKLSDDDLRRSAAAFDARRR